MRRDGDHLLSKMIGNALWRMKVNTLINYVHSQ